MARTLRNQMIDAMKLRRFSVRTQQSYPGTVTALSKYYKLSPDQIDSEKIRAYLVYLTVDCGRSWSIRRILWTCNVAVSAFRFFYTEVLGWEHARLNIPPRKKATKLPDVLSRKELEKLFACASSPRNRALLMATYAAGLRQSRKAG